MSINTRIQKRAIASIPKKKQSALAKRNATEVPTQPVITVTNSKNWKKRIDKSGIRTHAREDCGRDILLTVLVVSQLLVCLELGNY